MSKYYEENKKKKKKESQPTAGSPYDRAINSSYKSSYKEDNESPYQRAMAKMNGSYRPQGNITTTPPSNPTTTGESAYQRAMARLKGTTETQPIGNSKAIELNRKHYEDKRKENQPSVKPMASGNLVNTQAAKLNRMALTDEEIAQKKAETGIFNKGYKKYGTDKLKDDIDKFTMSEEDSIKARDITSSKRYEKALENAIKDKGLTKEEADRVMANNGSVPYAAYKEYYKEELANSPMEKQLLKFGNDKNVGSKYANAMVNYDLNSAEERADRATTREYEQSRIRNQEDFLERNQYEEDKSYIGNEDYDAVNNNLNAGTISDQLYEGSHLTMEQRQNYNYVYNTAFDEALAKAREWTSDEEEAQRRAAESAREEGQKYLDMVHADEARTDYFNEFAREYGEEHPTLAAATSVALTPIKSVSAAGNLFNLITGHPTDENSLINLPGNMSNTMRNSAQENLDKTWYGKLGYKTIGEGNTKKVFSAVTSVADNLLNNQLSLGNKGALNWLFTTQAGNDGYVKYLEMGYSPEDAAVMGITSGAIEYLTEKYSIEQMFNMDSKGLMQVIKSTVAEGSEEGASDILNEIADRVYFKLRDEESTYDKTISELMARGMSEEQAKAAYTKQFVNDLITDMEVGGLSGAGTNVVHQAINKAQIEYNQSQAEYNAVKNLDEGARNVLLNLAETSSDEKTQKMAAKVKETEGKKRNVYDTAQVIKRVIEENNIDTKIENDLKAEGVKKKDIATAKAAIEKSIAEVNLTDEEYNLIQTEPVKKVLTGIAEGNLDATYERQLAVNDAIELARNGGKTTQTQNVTPSTETAENGAENNVETADESKKVVALSNYARNAQQRLGTMPIESLNDIQDVVNDEEGNIQIVTNDGNKVNNPYVKNRALGVVINNATTLFNDGASAKSYIQNFDPAMNLKAYNTITTEMIKAGKADAGTDKSTLISTVKSLQNMGGDVGYYAKKLPASFFNDMYAYGVKEENQRSEVVASDPQRNVINAIASQFSNSGLNITIEDNNTEYNGKLVGTNNLVLSSHADKALMSVLSHELTHYFKKKTNLYNDYEKAVIDFLKESGQYEELVKAKKKQGYADNEIDEEIVADAAENFLSDKKVIDRVCKNDKNLANKIISWLNQTIKDLKKLFGSADPRTAEGRIMKNLEKQNLAKYEEIRNLWVNAYEAAAKSEKVTDTLQNESKLSKKFNGYEIDDDLYIQAHDENLNEEEKTKTLGLRQGQLALKNYKYIQNSTWTKIANAFKKLGYTDITNGKVAKETFSRLVDNSNVGYYIFNDDQAEAIKQIFGINSEKNDNTISPEKASEIAKKAEKVFGTTNNFKLAGYLDVNGKLLDFSEGQGYRVQDHREISEVLDLPEDADYSDGLIEFMNEGNIRLQEYGIDIAVKPNDEQRKVLRDFFNSLDGEVIVDFSNANGDSIGSAEYTRGTASARILNDIDSYFNGGDIPSGNADSLNQFRYSLKSDSQGRTLSDGQRKYFAESKIRDDKGNLLVVYHGTPNGEFTIFKNDLNFFSADKAYADLYQSASASARTSGKKVTTPKTFEGYINIEKPFTLSDPECMDIFINKYVKGRWAQGINPYLSDAEIREQIKDGIDWIEADNLKEFFDEEGYDYDGLILDEGGYFDENNNVVDRGNSFVTFNSNQFKNIDNENPTKDPDVRFSMKQPIEDSKGRKLSDNQQKFYANCEVRDAAGNLQVLYHQTDSDFTKFDTRRAGAGQHDFLTPYGVFLKPTSNDIGLKGKKQMELYANITNMLNVNSRYELENYIKKDADLKEAIDSMKAIDTEYQAKFDEAKKAWTKYIVENSKPGKSLRNDPELERLMDEESEIVEEWGNEYDKRAEKVKAKVDAYLRSQGYDGVHILNDEGSFGRKVETYIAFEPNQVKDVKNLNPTENVDIKHSLKADKDEIEKVWQQVKETVPAEIRDEVYKNDKGKGDYSAHQASINTIYYDKNNLKKATRYYDGFAIAYLMEKENYQIPHKPDGEVDYLQIDRDVRNVRNNDRKYGKWLKNLFSDAITENKLTLEDYLKERETTSSDYDVLKIRKLHQDEVVKYAEAYINDELSKDERLKFEQFRLVDKANPPFNDTSYWIRSPKDIMTFEEAINDDSALGMLPIEEGTTYEDLTAEMLQKAKESGIITVYHGGGKGIKNGDFVTPSKMMASEYAGDPSEVYAKTVNLSDVAWLDAEQGMYANRKGAKYSKKSLDDQVKDFREVDRYMPVAESILPLADFLDDYNAIDEGFNMDNAGDIAADIAKGNTTYIDIAKEMYENPYEYAVDDKEAEQIQRIAANAIGAYEEIERAKIEALEKNAGVKYSKKYTDADDDIFFNEDTWENSEAQNSAKNTADILKEGFNDLQKLKEAGKAHFTHADALRLAEKYQREYGTSTGKEYIANNIESIFAYIENNRDNVRYDDMLRVMRDAAMPIVEKQSNALDEYDDFRKYVKDLNIRLNDQQRAEVINTYGSMKTFRKAIGSRINVTDNGQNIDSLWQDICEASGYYLDPDENSNTQILALADALDSMRDIGDNSGMSTSDKAYDLALNIYTDYFKLNGVENITKQMKKQIEDYKAASEKAYKEILNKQKEESKIQLDKLRNELKRLEAEKEIASQDKIERADIDKELDRYRQRILKLKDEILVGKAWRRSARLKAAESRQKTILRNRIKSIVNDLSKRLTNPTEGHHVPEGLVNATIDVLQNIDLNTGKSVNMAEKLRKLSEKYEAVRKGYDGENPDYDPTLQKMIDQLGKMFEGRSIAKLSQNELEEVFTICKALQTQIRNMSKFIDSQIKEDIYKTGKNIIEDVNANKGVGEGKLANMANSYLTASVNAERFFNRLSGYKDDSALNKLYDDLNEGSHKMMQIEFDVSDIMKNVLEGDENQKLADKFKGDNKKDWIETPWKDKNGNTIKVPQSFRASLFMHMMNDQNMKHIMYGGFTLPNEKLYQAGKIKDAYTRGTTVKLVDTTEMREILKQINETESVDERNELWKKYNEAKDKAEKAGKATLKNFLTDMTPYERDWCRYAARYFHDYSGKKINETSLKLNGYAKAVVDNYFPIKTDPSFTRSDMEGVKLDATIEGWSNLKERVNGSNPIVIEGIDRVLNAHSKMLAKYVGMAIPIRNFNKVYGVTLGGYIDSVKKAIGSKFGERSNKFINDLFTDLQTSRTRDDALSKVMNTIRSNYAQAVLTTNLSVAWKQAASYPTAAAELGWDAIGKTMLSKAGLTDAAELALPMWLKKNTKEIMETAEKYTPLLKYRNLGNSTQELGDLKRQRTWLQKHKISNNIVTGLTNWIQNIDTTTVASLWKASEYRVAKDNANLQPGTDEFYKEVAKVFNKAVERTQPNYTVLQRPDILRSPNEFLKQVFMFKTQPLQNLGIMIDATGNLKAKANAYKADPSAENKAKVDKARKQFRRALTSQVAAAATFSAMTLAVNALLHNLNGYRDDDKELTLEAILKKYFKDVGGAMAGSLPLGTELYDRISSWVTGDKWYDLSVSSIDTINNIIKDIDKIYNADSTTKTIESTKKLIKDTSMLYGIPLGNIEKIYNGGKYHIEDIKNNEFGSFEAGVERSTKVENHRIYEAMKEGDWDKFDKLYAEEDPDKVTKGTTSVTSLIKEDYVNGKISEEEAETYLQEIGFSKDDAHFKIQDWNHADEEGGSSDYIEVYDAIDSYDTKAIVNAVNELKKYGYDNEKLQKTQNITKQYKDKYIELYNTNKTEAANLKSAILTYYQACGKNREKASKQVDNWVK